MSKTFGRVVGPLGGLFILFASLSRLLTGQFSTFVWAELALGVAGLVVWTLTAFDDARNLATGRGAQYVVMSAVTGLVLAVALGGANYVATHKKVQWDMTAKGIYTLSPETQGLLKGLTAQTKVTVTAFYQPLVDREYPVLNDLLTRYKAQNPDDFAFEFVDGTKNPQLVKQYDVSRTGPRVIFKSANGKEARAKEISEEALTNALAELNQGAAKKVYFLTGHGEKPMSSDAAKGGAGLQMWTDGLKTEGYDSALLNLFSQKDVPADALAVVVAGPQSPLADGEVAALQRYADKGGKLVVMLDPGYDTGLEKLVEGWGVKLGKGVVVDAESQEPMWAMTQTFSDHPLAKPRMTFLGAIPFFFPESRAVSQGSAPSGVKLTELFKTGANAWGETSPIPPDGRVTKDANDEPGPLSLAVAVEKGTGATETKAVVFGDSDFATNQYIRQGGNRDLALNTVEWLAGNASKITIRPKLRDRSTLVALTKSQGTLLSFGSLNLLPLALIAFGLSIWSLRRSK